MSTPFVASLVDNLDKRQVNELVEVLDNLGKASVDSDGVPEFVYEMFYESCCREVKDKLDKIRFLLENPSKAEKKHEEQNPEPRTPHDVFYIWRADDVVFEGLSVFKIGVTTSHIGLDRIRKVAGNAGFVPVDIHLFQTDNPFEIEKHLHRLFPLVPNIGNFDGKTEFRAATIESFKSFLEFAACFGTCIHPNN